MRIRETSSKVGVPTVVTAVHPITTDAAVTVLEAEDVSPVIILSRKLMS